VVLTVLWMIGLPIYVMADSNRRASEFYAWCRSVESNSASDIIPEQQHEACWRSAKFMTPSVLAETLIAGNADTATLWTFILGPVVILWIVGSIILAPSIMCSDFANLSRFSSRSSASLPRHMPCRLAKKSVRDLELTKFWHVV
jgi:hypothetical protein